MAQPEFPARWEKQWETTPPGSGLKGQGVEVRDAGMPQGAGMGPVDWECHPVRGAFVMEVEGEKGRE